MVDLDNAVQPLRDLTGCEIVFVNPPESTAARGTAVMADSIAGEKAFHVRVGDLSFKLLDIEAGVCAVNAGGALFSLNLETGDGHFWNKGIRAAADRFRKTGGIGAGGTYGATPGFVVVDSDAETWEEWNTGNCGNTARTSSPDGGASN